MRIERGISQRELDRYWLDAGGKIADVRRTGERRYVASDGRKSAPYNRRRKDASLRLLTFARNCLGAIGSPATSPSQQQFKDPLFRSPLSGQWRKEA